MVHQDFNRRQGLTVSELISQLRLPLIVLVTYAHSYGQVDEGYSLLHSDWDAYQVLKLLVSQTLVKVVVPVFFVISGYLFFANVREWNMSVYCQKMRRRLKTLLLPYLLWNLLMALKLHAFSWDMLWVYDTHAGMQTDWLGCENWMTAPANMPLWFLRDLMVVSLLTPIIYIGVKRFGWYLMVPLTLFYLSGIGAFAVPGLSMYAVYFFTLGAFFAIRKINLLNVLQRYQLSLLALAVILASMMMATYHQPVFSSLMLCFRLVGALAVFGAGRWLLVKTDWRLPKVVADASYFVYLAHYVFFMSFIDDAFFCHFGDSSASLCLHYLLCPLLKAAIFIALYVAYRRVKQLCYTNVS